MTAQEAIKILHPESSFEALLGYTREEGLKIVEEACVLACEALEKQIPKKPHPFTAFDGIERNGCPRCFEELGRNEILYAGQRFCSVCGQAIEKNSLSLAHSTQLQIQHNAT